MPDDRRLDLVYRVLDLQLVDVEGRRCGKVDDLELARDPFRVVALHVGRGVYPRRIAWKPLARLARRLFGPEVLGDNLVRVPWEDVDEIGATIRLRRPAAELGLGRGDDELGPVVAKLLLTPPERP
jgi:sporulation protein YlmC with PRC-barrel domain